MASGGGHETEIKLKVNSAADGASRLSAGGFTPITERLFEANTLYDTPNQQLRGAGKLLRVRQVGASGLLTFKGPGRNSGPHKSREEVETPVADPERMGEILLRLGFLPSFRYEKYRTEFRGPGDGLALLDETPIGCFLELEGEPDWIDEQALKLGFQTADYITVSYGGLYLEWCRERGVEPAHMTF